MSRPFRIALAILVASTAFVNVHANTIADRSGAGLDWRLPDLTGLGQQCLGVSSVVAGLCSTSADCSKTGGTPDGPCALDAAKVCCVRPVIRCGATILTNNTVWANHEYPKYNHNLSDSTCSIRLQIPAVNVRYIKIVFDQFEFAQPDAAGRCAQDKFEVEGIDARVTGVLPLCGYNSGQHLYLPIATGSAHVTLKAAFTGSWTEGRKWSIRILYYDEHSPMLPPAGCRQFFGGHEIEGNVMSFNYDLSKKRARGCLTDLKYAVCWRRLASFCRVQLEAQYFDLEPSNVQALNIPLDSDLSPCARRDRIGLPPSSDGASQVGSGVFCGRSFNQGRPYTIADEPLVMYFESGRAPGQGFALKYRYQLC